MKNIAIFTDNLNVGGIQRSVVNLLERLDKTEYSIDLYLFQKDNFYSIPEGVNVIYLKKPSKLFQMIFFKITKRLMKVDVLDKKYDISIDFDSYQMHTAVGALSCNSAKKAIWIHNDIPIKLKEEFKYRILHFFFQSKYDYFDAYCAVSKGALDSFRTLVNRSDKEYLVIPNAINTSEIMSSLDEKCDLEVDHDNLNIVSVGRLCHQKGYDIMIENMRKIVDHRKDVHLYIIGEGPDEEALKTQIVKLGLDKYVTLLGKKKNPFKYMKLMDLFYLSSRYEGQGMVILEAKACGLDTIVPRHLEKYCPYANGSDDVVEYIEKYKKHEHGKYDDLKDYNDDIVKTFEKLVG